MEERRQNPEEILQRIEKENENKNCGHLKIFFGYAAGVGKTYAMLKAAHAAKQRGIDVVIGYVEPHARPQTAQLQDGLEMLPKIERIHGNITLSEFDLDAALQRKPQLLLVDELAHSNAETCRHRKRYQDIKELLNHGIDVYTTVNVQHLESLNDVVASITGITVKERIPDSIFDEAYQVELVDIEPNDLMERLNEGKIYHKEQAARALDNFFTAQNLVALREIALRRCADRVNKISKQSGRTVNADEHILVCLSSSPTNAKNIRTAARMANAFQGQFTALFVETPALSGMSQEDQERLYQNTHLAQQLGATIETVTGDDIALQISEFARLSGVSKIVLGRSSSRRNLLLGRPSLTEKLTQLSPNLDIYIIPDQNTPSYKEKKRTAQNHKNLLVDSFKSACILLFTTATGFLFYQLGFSEANIITVYILGVLLIAITTAHRELSLISSVISVLLFNFLFTEPRFSFQAYDTGYPITFLIMFIAAFLTSSLTTQIKRQARLAAATAYRTKILLDTNQLLNNENNFSGIVTVTCNQLMKLLEKDIIFYPVQKEMLAAPLLFPKQNKENCTEYLTEHESAVASWVYHNNKHAGATTNTLGDSKCLYLSVRMNQEVYGVVGIALEKIPLDAFENSIVLSILGECALALKNEQTSKEREEAALLAKNEQLRANLLRSISHDLRTPLTSISGNAGILLASEENIAQEKRKQLYAAIYDDALWLINLVENLLSVTRIENGTMQLHLTTELLEEIVAEALQHTDRRREEHNIHIIPADTFLLVKADARLIMQVIINLVDNAIKYTPQGSDIYIATKSNKKQAIVTVTDTGTGISDDAKLHIFDMFYTDSNKCADSRRNLGLGLALCKSIITAHGGDITVTDHKPHGAIFTFTLPLEEVQIHE